MADESAPAAADFTKTLSEITSREKDLKDKWWEKAGETWKIYTGDQVNETPFNILYSNTEILVPAVFSKKPIPDVRRRFDKEKGDVPAHAMQNMLAFLLDSNIGGYSNFMTVCEDAVLDAALPGQGQIRVRIVSGIPVLDYVQYHKFIWGYCERWEDCPWQAFRYDMTWQDAVKQFELTEEQAAELKAYSSSDMKEKNENTKEEKPPTLAVYELWRKSDRTVQFLCEGLKSGLLAQDQDLGLTGFFPVPKKPLTFLHSTTDTLPRPLYKLYKQQAEELNDVTRRIKKLTNAIKVRGMYAGQLPELAKIFEGDNENMLIPAESPSQVLAMDKGLEAYIWMAPIDKFITVLQTLFQIRDQIKGTIYEILGIGDILRGQSKASETLGAQQIKDKWGSLRIAKTRDRVTDFIRDGLRLLAESAAKHTPVEQWASITGIQLAQPVQAMVQGRAGQPVPQGQSWQDVLGVLQSDLERAYTVDIELNSTVDPEATQEKEETAGFMNAIGSAMQAMAPLAQSSPEGFETMKVILGAITSKFRIGVDVQDKIMALPVPKALTGPPPELQKAQEEVQKAQEELKKRAEQLRAEDENVRMQIATIKDLQAAVDQTKKEIASDRQEFIREQASALKELQLIQKEIGLERDKLALQGQKNVLDVKVAKQPPKPTTPGGAK